MAALVVALPSAATAQLRNFDLPAQAATKSIPEFARQAGIQIVAPGSKLRKIRTRAIVGQQDVRAALNALLAGTGLRIVADDGRTVTLGVITPATGTSSTAGAPALGEAQAGSAAAADERAEIVVTGTHIRGAPVAAPVTVISRQDMQTAGQNDMGEVVRSLPQNFNGGQNPGVSYAGAISNGNVNSASSINLRGLGTDATLTLLNGHRLPQDSAFSGVDISAIPVAAIDRIEIVADGASALYGSDAVGGVANVILRRDFEGLVTSARVGGSTEGGNFQNQEGFVTGHRWSSGGLMLTYDYDRATKLSAYQRDYTTSMGPDTTLLPAQRRHAVVVTGHQEISDTASLSVDALYNHRASSFAVDSVTGSPYRQYYAPTVETFSIAPELTVKLPSSWEAKVTTSYGADRSHYASSNIPATGAGSLTTGCYCDSAINAEASANGPLFSLPGGSAHAAFGGGYRANKMDYSRILNGTQTGAFTINRKSYYLYGELALPLLKPDSPTPFLKSLSVSAAARYENYPGLAQLTTPKFGLIYEPNADFTIKSSWGRSFKAPTLYEQYVGYQTLLFSAANYGAGPAGKTFLYLAGGNPDLKPERARSWTAGAEFHPVKLPGLRIEAGYFSIHYADRAVQPISGSIASAFANAGYASLLSSNPSVATLNSLFAGSLYGLQNFSGLTYDPSAVVAMVDNRYRNVAQQNIQGVDIALQYRRPLGETQSIIVSGSSSYLESTQQVTADLPPTQLAGTLFNPPHWRARGGVTWQNASLTLAGFVNYTGALLDTRYTPRPTVAAMATIDLTESFKIRFRKRRDPDLEVGVSILNLLDRKPQLIRTTSSAESSYDTTNSSPAGRVLGLTVSRKW